MRSISAHGQKVGWAVLLGRTIAASTNGPPFPRINEVTLRLCLEEAGRYRCPSSNGPLDDPRFGHDPAASVTLECVDLDGDGTDEVIVTENRPGASWQPSCAFLFCVAPGKLVPLATITSHYPVQLTGLADRNQFVIPATYAIGRTLAHYAQPRWTDYYGFDGKQVFLANRLWPEQFRERVRVLKDLLKGHPNDAELWSFLGRAYQALGEAQNARPALAKANSLGYTQPDWKLLQAGVQLPAQPFELPRMWEYSSPLIAPENRLINPSRAQKDPSVVFDGGNWHVFMTVKLAGKSAIESCSFRNWEEANASPRTILKVSDSDYYCAPQVFYFRPHQKWYLVYQMGVLGQDKMWVAYSTTADLSDANSWSRAKPILDGGKNDPRRVGGLDYWIICDDQRAYLFLTSLDGKMWRLWTRLEDFPRGFEHCELALQARIYEASHTYRLKGMNKYLTIVEENGRRFYKAYVADRLDGTWVPVADSAERPFAGWKNIRPAAGVESWTDNISHGELIREGRDETLTVDPGHLRFVFQGMLDKHKSGKQYGQFQWRIGLLTPVPLTNPR